MATTATLKDTPLTSFPRGDTPLLVVPVTVGGATVSIAGYTGYITFTTNSNPSNNQDATIHQPMITSTGDTLGLGYTNYFYYQFTNSDTEKFDPTKTYHWDVQINKDPVITNNFTIAKGTFSPLIDFGRGLS